MTSPANLQLAGYIRASAYAIAFFDYLQSLPAEYRVYSRQKGPFQLSLACILFILVRYLGLMSIVLGNVGFFYHGFSEESCRQYFWLTPVFKFSQIILALRTYAVSRKSIPVRNTLIVLYIVCMAAETISSFWKRISRVICTSGNLPGVKMASLYHIGGLLFDLVTMAITSIYLWKFSITSRTSLGQLASRMLQDGIMYFVALSVMNIVNLVLYQSNDPALQTCASTLGFAATMIFSSRFILNLSDHSARDGISDQHHSSRTPTHNPTGAFRGANNTSNGEPELVVKVMQNVITMSDMDDDSGKWAADQVHHHKSMA
ncbi:hypothetical protein B0H13DRAFT_2346889 [Mycena leptocephala]|nr:hypothetical protein B0H13DRAFT_2346889 [Mycena leptocephala]